MGRGSGDVFREQDFLTTFDGQEADCWERNRLTTARYVMIVDFKVLIKGVLCLRDGLCLADAWWCCLAMWLLVGTSSRWPLENISGDSALARPCVCTHVECAQTRWKMVATSNCSVRRKWRPGHSSGPDTKQTNRSRYTFTDTMVLGWIVSLVKSTSRSLIGALVVNARKKIEIPLACPAGLWKRAPWWIIAWLWPHVRQKPWNFGLWFAWWQEGSEGGGDFGPWRGKDHGKAALVSGKSGKCTPMRGLSVAPIAPQNWSRFVRSDVMVHMATEPTVFVAPWPWPPFRLSGCSTARSGWRRVAVTSRRTSQTMSAKPGYDGSHADCVCPLGEMSQQMLFLWSSSPEGRYEKGAEIASDEAWLAFWNGEGKAATLLVAARNSDCCGCVAVLVELHSLSTACTAQSDVSLCVGRLNSGRRWCPLPKWDAE